MPLNNVTFNGHDSVLIFTVNSWIMHCCFSIVLVPLNIFMPCLIADHSKAVLLLLFMCHVYLCYACLSGPTALQLPALKGRTS